MPSQRGAERGIAPATLGLSVSAVARRLGVAPATLRTWDRRYGVGPSQHEAGSHRRYSALDVARLEYLRRLVNSGVPLADAAQAACAMEAEAFDEAETSQTPPRSPRLVVVPSSDESETSSRAGGGHILAIPGGAPGARGLARAAQALDIAACTELVCESIDKRGVMWTWENFVVPVLIAVGEQWRTTGRGVEVEHALSESIEAALKREVSHLTSTINVRPVLLASAPEDHHSIPLYALAAALAERGIGTRVLGARLPTEALQQSVSRIGPAAVFLWAQIPGTADAVAATRIPVTRPGVAIVLGGQGWSGELPAGVVHASSLGDATALIARAVGE